MDRFLPRNESLIFRQERGVYDGCWPISWLETGGLLNMEVASDQLINILVGAVSWEFTIGEIRKLNFELWRSD